MGGKRTGLVGSIITLIAFGLGMLLLFDYADHAIEMDERSDLIENRSVIDGPQDRPHTNAQKQHYYDYDRNDNVIGPLNRTELVMLFIALSFLLVSMALVGDKYSGRVRR